MAGEIDYSRRSFLPQKAAITGNMEGLNPDLVARLNKLQGEWGQPLNVISGYRDPNRNAAVGGARGSQHIQGNAVDLDTGSYGHDDRLKLIGLATKHGFGGLGVYNNNLHFDVGPRRAWGPDYSSGSVPGWAQTAVNTHVGGSDVPMPEQRPTAFPQGSPDQRMPPRTVPTFDDQGQSPRMALGMQQATPRQPNAFQSAGATWTNWTDRPGEVAWKNGDMQQLWNMG
jgi:Peptidase M15